jgi:hypothetical protein
MSELSAVQPPRGWITANAEGHAAVYLNEEHGLEVVVRPVSDGTHVRSQRGDPTQYVVELTQDWFATGLHGERELSATAGSREAAADTADSFMREFVDELKTGRTAEAVHRGVAGHEAAADVVASEVAADALADAAGYSDDLLESVVRAETGGPVRLIAHRNGDEVTTVAGDQPDGLDIRTVHGVFPVDGEGTRQVLDEPFPIATAVHLGSGTLYRFVFSERRETDVLLASGTQVTSPAFERAVCTVLEEKWER